MNAVRGLRVRPLAFAVTACALFALLGAALVGDELGGWYEALEKPWFLVPLPVFYAVGVIYYVLFATVLYRASVHVADRRGRVSILALTLLILLLNELWNYAFFGLRSTLAGFLGIAVFLVPLTVLLFALWRYERPSARLVGVYWVWVVYDLVWTFALWRMNGGA